MSAMYLLRLEEEWNAAISGLHQTTKTAVILASR